MLGPPTEQELALHLSDEGRGSLELASAAAACAFGRYWAGDWEGVSSPQFPASKPAARELLLQLDVAAYRIARSHDPGKYVGLGVLLDLLTKNGLDPSWERFLRTLLTGPLA